MTSALLDHLWQSTLFCIATWMITILMRGNSAAVRHGLWLAASLKFLVPFSAFYLLGAAAGISPPVESQPDFLPAVFEAAAPVVSPITGVDSPSWGSFLAFGWLSGSVWLALRWVRDWRLAHEYARTARPAVGSPPGLCIVDDAIEPSVARVVRPVVLVSASLLEGMRPARLAAVLAHEREHVARHDILKAQLHRLVETLFWFHPLVWFVGRRLVEERERACDEAVLAQGHDAGEYAAGILDVCRHCAAVRPLQSVSALAGNLPRRVATILDGRPPESLGFLKSFLLSIAAFLLAVVPLFAGTIDEATRHRQKVDHDMRVLMNADVVVQPLAGSAGVVRLHAGDSALSIHDVSLRELLALAYDVSPGEIGGRDWLDTPRYDIRAALPGNIASAADFDPAALRGMVTRLLAARFNLEIHVNHRCQQPCGPRALPASR
jgi:beta-lactamase regulating signal transducer with metallopeptidase domain